MVRPSYDLLNANALLWHHGFPQDFYQMACLPPGGMLNLLPTRDAVCHNLYRTVRGFHRWEEPLTTNLHGDLVVFRFIAE